jgi:ATP-binding cassette, subfamily B, bacterial
MLRSLLGAQRGMLALGLTAAFVQQVAMLALPWGMQHAIDDGITTGSQPTALAWASVVAAVAVVMLASAVCGQWWTAVAAHRAARSLRADLMDRVVTLDRAAAGRFGHGDLAIRATRDVDLVRDWMQGLAAWVRIAVTVAVVLPAVALLDPLLLAVSLVMLPLLLGVNVVFPRRFGRANEDLSRAHGDRADAVEDLLSASAAVRGIGGERVLVRRHHVTSERVTQRTLGVARIASWWSSVPPAIPRLAIVAGLAAGGVAVLDGDMTVGGLVAFTSWMTILATAAAVLVDMLANRGQARVAAARIAEVLAAAPAVADPPDPVPLPAGDLVASGIVVARDGRRVVGPLDLTAPAGAFVAVTGPTGSGKSLLVRVLCRLDDPDEGTVGLGGVDLRAAALAQVRTRIGVVPQRPIVLSGTVSENLLLGRDLPHERVRAACRAAAADAFVSALPDGYDTVLGELGTSLSGGQVQRLALARALLGRPDVLLLDDVTSAVDPDTERVILDGIRDWLPHSTVVAVTHRPAVLAAADTVVRLSPSPAAVAGG